MSRRVRTAAGVVLPGAISLAVLLIVWQGAVWLFDIRPFLLPGPGRVVRTAVQHRGDLLTAVRLTAAAALGGLALSIALGTLIAVLFSRSPLLERACYPYAIFLQTVPVMAVAPVVIQLSGHGPRSIVIISCVISLFPVIANGTIGLRAVSPTLLDLFTLYNASPWQVLLKLRLPAAVPYFVAGSRIASGLAVLGAIVAESFTQYNNDQAGLGFLIVVTFRQQETAYLYAAAIASAFLGVAFFWLVGLVDAVLVRRWRVGVAGGPTAGGG